jgi:hypothetical protein
MTFQVRLHHVLGKRSVTDHRFDQGQHRASPGDEKISFASVAFGAETTFRLVADRPS